MKATTIGACLSDLSGTGPVLIATNKQDVTVDFIVRELRQRSVPFLRLNTEDLPATILSFDEGHDLGGSIQTGTRSYSLDAFQSGYYRRPEAPIPHAGLSSEAAAYAVQEWSAAARTIWNTLEGRWLNSPFAILRAEDKPRQLTVARKVGLSVPTTIIGNNFDAACALVANRRCIVKPLRRALIEDPTGPGSVIYTTELEHLNERDRAAFTAVPLIVQEKIEKNRDVRVTVVDERVAAVAISSQDRPETSVDWRRGSRTDLLHERIELPDNIVRKCIEVTKALDLRFAAIDLVHDCDGAYWFLEANPNGQWAWLEAVDGISIAAMIVDALTKSRLTEE